MFKYTKKSEKIKAEKKKNHTQKKHVQSCFYYLTNENKLVRRFYSFSTDQYLTVCQDVEMPLRASLYL